MIKASAGGGGKGMRIAWNDEETRYVSLEEGPLALPSSKGFTPGFLSKPEEVLEVRLGPY